MIGNPRAIQTKLYISMLGYCCIEGSPFLEDGRDQFDYSGSGTIVHTKGFVCDLLEGL